MPLELDIASQGETEEEALANLKEAIELHFEAPRATRPPQIRTSREIAGSRSKYSTVAAEILAAYGRYALG